MDKTAKRALYALGLMWNQYCGSNGHSFMSAGEEAAEVLIENGLLKDEWSEVDDTALDLLLKEPD